MLLQNQWIRYVSFYGKTNFGCLELPILKGSLFVFKFTKSRLIIYQSGVQRTSQ